MGPNWVCGSTRPTPNGVPTPLGSVRERNRYFSGNVFRVLFPGTFFAFSFSLLLLLSLFAFAFAFAFCFLLLLLLFAFAFCFCFFDSAFAFAGSALQALEAAEGAGDEAPKPA